MSSSNFFPYPPKRPAGLSSQTVKGVTDYLQSHDKMGSLLPTVNRIAALQKACLAALPALFDKCAVLHFNAGQLMIGAPNAAIISKLRQKIPHLQEILQKQGWQVNAIRLKVQVVNLAEKPIPSKQIILPVQAVSALAALENALEPSARNTALKAALRTMVSRHHGKK